MVKEILEHLISYAPALSKDKFSGVHEVEQWNCYRVHIHYVIPTFAQFIISVDTIEEYINRYFSTRAGFEKSTGWFTIYK